MYKRVGTRGFTIVELLIVIVVIAILAAISIVAYNGIQQRSTNSAVQNAYVQVEKLVRLYAVDRQTPLLSGRSCASKPACNYGSNVALNTTFESNISAIGSLPTGVPVVGAPTYGGIIYDYSATRTYEGVVTPVVLMYALAGANQDCGREVASSGFAAVMTKSTNGRSGSTATTTLCAVPIKGV